MGARGMCRRGRMGDRRCGMRSVECLLRVLSCWSCCFCENSIGLGGWKVGAGAGAGIFLFWGLHGMGLYILLGR